MKISEAREDQTRSQSVSLSRWNTKLESVRAPDSLVLMARSFPAEMRTQWPNTDGTLECVIGKYSANKWGVFGLYECKKSNTLTGEEFLSLPEEVSNYFDRLWHLCPLNIVGMILIGPRGLDRL